MLYNRKKQGTVIITPDGGFKFYPALLFDRQMQERGEVSRLFSSPL